MKISNNTNFNITKINYCAGKTRLYTDFDGTYFPFSQDAIIWKDEKSTSDANKMYHAFAEFMEKAKEKFSFFITTGRSKLEMFGILNDFKNSDVKFKLPDGYILRDGFEEIQDIKRIAYDRSMPRRYPEEIDDIKKIINETDRDITFFEPISNKKVTGKDGETLEGIFKRERPFRRHKYVSIVYDDSGMIELAYSPNISIKQYYRKISEYYRKKNIPVNITYYIGDTNLHVPCQEAMYSEKYRHEPANTIFIKPLKDGKASNKLNQPKKEVENIVNNQSNDLVVVAGDASNDYEMLNPLNYIDIFEVNVDTQKPIQELLEREDVISAIKKLPLISIVVGENMCMEPILEMKEILDKKGIKKIFYVKNPSEEFLNKIKFGMLVYADNNNEYKYNLGYDLYKEILE